jgi:hypothetical protein
MKAVMYVNNTEQSADCDTVSESIAYLSAEMDAGRGYVGEVQVDNETIADVRRKSGVTKIKVYDPSFFNGLNLTLSTPIVFEGAVVQTEGVTQSFGTNVKIGGSVSFGDVKQIASHNQELFTKMNIDGDLNLGNLEQKTNC